MSDHAEPIVQLVEIGASGSLPKKPPNWKFVLGFADGTVRAYVGRPSLWDRIRSEHCFLIDTSVHQLTAAFTVPAQGDAYHFSVQLGAAWQVVDTTTVAGNRMYDVPGLVTGALQQQLWLQGRQYAPHAATELERAAGHALQNGMTLAEGVSILRVTVRVQVDPSLPRQKLALDEVEHENEIEKTRFKALQTLSQADNGMIIIEVMNHPENLSEVLKMIVHGHDRDAQSRLDLLDRLLEHKLIQDSDAQPLRDEVNGIRSTYPQSIGGGSTSIDPLAGTHAAPADDTVQHPTTPAPSATLDPETGSPDIGSPDTGRPGEAGGLSNWRPLPNRGAGGSE
ncbi:hypothetical protein ACIA58_23445 [Kribbella sp. NPDC051586]|uniref:hypothetical protein n=1 Tax=Kribbella sp. NPDC051586 TaxID=3364118 RepID=UPI0037ACA8A1